jgi:hypothetical protein
LSRRRSAVERFLNGYVIRYRCTDIHPLPAFNALSKNSGLHDVGFRRNAPGSGAVVHRTVEIGGSTTLPETDGGSRVVDLLRKAA